MVVRKLETPRLSRLFDLLGYIRAVIMGCWHTAMVGVVPQPYRYEMDIAPRFRASFSTERFFGHHDYSENALIGGALLGLRQLARRRLVPIQ